MNLLESVIRGLQMNIAHICLVNLYKSYKVFSIQADNGFEFTNRLSWNAFAKNKKIMFEEMLRELVIKHKLIKTYTPKENGRVERNHRKD